MTSYTISFPWLPNISLCIPSLQQLESLDKVDFDFKNDLPTETPCVYFYRSFELAKLQYMHIVENAALKMDTTSHISWSPWRIRKAGKQS